MEFGTVLEELRENGTQRDGRKVEVGEYVGSDLASRMRIRGDVVSLFWLLEDSELRRSKEVDGKE